jgi:hypothetical protein
LFRDSLTCPVQLFCGQTTEFSKVWNAQLNTVADAQLMSEIKKADKADYIAAVQNLSDSARAGATAWLQSIVDEVAALWN